MGAYRAILKRPNFATTKTSRNDRPLHLCIHYFSVNSSMDDSGAGRHREPSKTRSKASRHSSRHRNGEIEALDFDSNRKARDGSRHTSGASSPVHLLRDNESLLSNVVDGIIQEDRQKMKAQLQRYMSYGSAILSWLV